VTADRGYGEAGVDDDLHCGAPKRLPRAAALKARNSAFFDSFQDLSLSAETCSD
jgi:hypothetical protein